MRLLQRSVAALALALLMIGPAPAPALAQNERPDLAIELLPFDPAKPREVRVRVTNVGQWWADTTTATVETTAPTSGNSKTEKIPDLGPKGDKDTASQFEFTYTLAADCDGHTVKASLKPAKTFNGNTESNLANNTAGPVKVCETKAAPKPSGPPSSQSGGVVVAKPVGEVAEKPPESTTSMIDTKKILRPPHLLLGSHTREVPATLFRPHGLYRENEGLLPFSDCEGFREEVSLNVPNDVQVGFAYHDWTNCEINRVHQLIVNFDLTEFQYFDVNVTRATLLFKEDVAATRDVQFNPENKSCVGSLGVAPSNYTDMIERKELVNSTYRDREWAGGGWVVTPEISRTAGWPKAPLSGFVFHGVDENLDAESNAICVSRISDVRLKLEYTVLN